MTAFAKLFEPGRIGTMVIRNRIVMAPMQTFSYEFDGTPNSKTIDYFVARAQGGVGLIICPGAKPSLNSRVIGTPSLYDDSFIPQFKSLCEAIHAAGAKVAQQINHPGKALTYTGREAQGESPEAIGPSPLRYVKTGTIIREATKEDIRRLVEDISEAARRVRDAGFDMVEFHAAHGYLLGSFLSPFTNRRTDEYGGTPERRARFVCEIIERTRQKVGPNFPICVRISGSEFLKGGSSITDTLIQAPLLVEAGADALHISAGAHENTEVQILSYLWPDAYLTQLAAAVKKVVKVPVIAVGKLGDPNVAERVLAEGRADFVALGRTLLADPEWPNKVRKGKRDEIRRCISCNNCWERLLTESRKHGRLFCTVNPALLREKEFKLTPATKKKRVMVIGGGLAGMEAARVAGVRGHDVTLYERTGALGGQWLIACRQPGKEIYQDVLRHLISDLHNAGVRIRLNSEVTPRLVQKVKPDVVVLATGACPKTLSVPGIEGPNVVQAVDVILGKAKAGNKVVVIGGRLVGMEVALALSEQGKNVSIATMRRLGENGRKLEDNIYRTLRDRLIARGVRIYPGCPLLEVREDGVFVDDDGNVLFIEADTVVLAVGSAPRNEMAAELKLLVSELYVIGDCREPRDALEALHEGAEIGRAI